MTRFESSQTWSCIDVCSTLLKTAGFVSDQTENMERWSTQMANFLHVGQQQPSFKLLLMSKLLLRLDRSPTWSLARQNTVTKSRCSSWRRILLLCEKMSVIEACKKYRTWRQSTHAEQQHWISFNKIRYRIKAKQKQMAAYFRMPKNEVIRLLLWPGFAFYTLYGVKSSNVSKRGWNIMFEVRSPKRIDLRREFGPFFHISHVGRSFPWKQPTAMVLVRK